MSKSAFQNDALAGGKRKAGPPPQAAGSSKYTYERMVKEIPESNLPCELWDGKVIMAPAPFYAHQKIVMALSAKLHLFVQERGLGEVLSAPFDMVLSPHQVVQPDILFIAKERLSILQNVLMGPADLVVEVISRGSRRRDRMDKRDLYSQYAVKEYWIIDPEAKTIEVFGFDQLQLQLNQRVVSGQKALSRLLPGFEVEADRLFAHLINSSKPEAYRSGNVRDSRVTLRFDRKNNEMRSNRTIIFGNCSGLFD